MNEVLFQIVFWGLILFGGPALFFLIPFIYSKTLDKVEDEGFRQVVERQNWMLSNKLIIPLIIIGTALYGVSIIFVAKVNYSSIQSIYYNSLLGDLFRYFAFIFWGTFVLLLAITGFAERIKFPEKKLFTFIFSIGFLLIVGLSINETVKDLTNEPQEATGILSDKWESRSGGKIPEYHYYLKVSGIADNFEMSGDNSENGFEKVREGNRVRLWYGYYSRKAFLVEKL